MSPGLALQILEHTQQTNKELYRAALASVAELRKLRPMFFERIPRAQRHTDMVAALAKPRLELTSASLLRDWLMNRVWLEATLDGVLRPPLGPQPDRTSAPALGYGRPTDLQPSLAAPVRPPDRRATLGQD